MGDAEGADGAVDSDYSGRPIRRPTAEDMAGVDMWTAPGDFVSAQLADGTFVNEGPDGRLYYQHFDGYRPIWDRPVDPADYPEGRPLPNET